MDIRYTWNMKEFYLDLGSVPKILHLIYIRKQSNFTFLYLCVHMHREVTGQLKRIGSLLLPCESCSSNSVIRLGTRLLCPVSHLNTFKILEWVTLWTLSIWDMIYYRMKFKGGEWKKHIKTQKPEAKTMNLSWAYKMGGRTFRLLPSPRDKIWHQLSSMGKQLFKDSLQNKESCAVFKSTHSGS